VSKKISGRNTNNPFHKPEEHHPPGKDSTKKIPKLIGKAANYAGSAKPKKVQLGVIVNILMLLLFNCWLFVPRG